MNLTYYPVFKLQFQLKLKHFSIKVESFTNNEYYSHKINNLSRNKKKEKKKKIFKLRIKNKLLNLKNEFHYDYNRLSRQEEELIVTK